MPGAQPVDFCPPSMCTNLRIYGSTPSDPYISYSKSVVHDMQNLHIYDNTLNDPSNVEGSLYPTAGANTINLRGIQGVDHAIGDVPLSAPQSFSTNLFVASERTVRHNLRVAPSTSNSPPAMHGERPYPNVRVVNTRQVSKTAPYICQWRTETGSVCGDVISWATCGEHLAIAHRIKYMT
ncbi:hypothetical protein BDN67DRAFT_686121, partial [Paxillus ammoniavirescens]